MTESESIRDADGREDAREALYRDERYDDGFTPVRRARLDDYTLELIAQAEQIRAERLAARMVDVFTRKQVR